MNILFLKLYITEDVDNKFYNSQEIGMAKALVDIHPEHRVDIVLLSNKISEERSSEISPGITLAFDLPTNFDGNIYLTFKAPWYWLVAYGISMITALLMALYIIESLSHEIRSRCAFL